MVSRKSLNRMFSIVVVACLLLGGVGQVGAAATPPPPGVNANGNGKGKGNGQMRSMTVAARKAARLNQAPQQKGVSKTFAGVNSATAAFSPLAAGPTALAQMSAPLSTPDYFGVANWANSPLPAIITPTGVITGGMRKFVDTLPGLSLASPVTVTGNDLGQYIPVAFADTTSFTGTATNPAADYYEIGLVQYREQLHADLPPVVTNPTTHIQTGGTLLRGYVQLETPANASVSKHVQLFNPDGTPILRSGLPVFALDKPSYLGPVILAGKNRPVRVTFTNFLPAGAGGDLFIPTDTTYMGAGMGPDGTPYSENRATLHLHGGNTPWISDGTPHQWTVPANETSTNFKKGVSVGYVPDMWFDASGNPIPSCAQQTTCAVAGATNNPGAGRLTFYWTNQQGGRLMFYHDHAYGITRLNVYAGEAAGYLLTDPNEENLLAAATVPGTLGTTPDLTHTLPLVIQDKSFVPDNGVAGGQLAATDPTWDVARYGGFGNLWFPHVYMPNQNPADVTGANAFGRWDYGPWFFPPQDPSTFVATGRPFQCTSAAYTAANPPAFPPLMCPGTPNPSGTPEGFMDTPLVNGTAYPSLTVDPAAYRFQLLSAGNDRTWNLGLYVADPLAIAVTNGGSGYTTPPTVGLVGGGGSGAVLTSTISTGSVTAILVTGVGSGYISVPNVTITGDGTGATAVAVIDPLVGQVTAVNVTNIGTGYTFATVAIDPPAGCATGCVTAAAAAQLTPAGAVLGVIVTNPGSGWTSNPTVTFTGGGGTGATAIASINTEVKMLPAVPPTAASALKLCSTATATSGAQLALATIVNGNPVNNTGLPPNCWPTTWPTDGRDGGVPDPTTAGPPIIQIGTEGGLLPAPAVIPSTPTGYEYNRRSITVLNVFTHGLLVGPAERADVVVDFSKFAGKTLLLYNDAPAPVPAFDPRSDYYTGDPDQTIAGGAPTTLPGYGPNTRTVMQIKVNATATNPNVTPFVLSSVTAAQPNTFATTQDKIIVPEPAFPAANGGGGPNYVKIQDTSITAWIGGPVGGLRLTSGGAGYTSAPGVSITGGGGTGATAIAALAPTSVGTLALTNGGSGYTSAPAVAFSGGGGTGAAATATLATRSVASVTVTKQGSGYTSIPTVTFSPPQTAGGTTATGTAVVVNRRVTAINLTNPGSGYVSAPTVTISGGGGSGATATAALAPAAVASLTLTNGGSGYTSAPTVSFSGGGGSGAAATATLVPTVVASISLTSGGNGYTGAPVVAISAPQTAGSTATAVATASVTPLQPKAIQELFTLDYGRMNATLGVELPLTNFLIQTTIPYGYVDPPTEIFKDGEIQLWKITHNGVDTHFIHFHLFNVQVVNRVGWDGAIKPPDANELAWKDTVRMNPLEDVVVALKLMKPNLPWDLPNSIRPLDVTEPVGSSLGFTNVDPTNQPAAVTNDLTNFGWEYVWHCHILGHEENDMMRAMVLAVPPKVPGAPVATLAGSGNTQSVVLTWADNSLNETGFTIQRATNGTWTTVGTVGPNVTTFTDTTIARRTAYRYRVIANNLVGYTKTYAAPAVGYPHTSADSVPSGPSNTITTQ